MKKYLLLIPCLSVGCLFLISCTTIVKEPSHTVSTQTDTTRMPNATSTTVTRESTGHY